MWHVQGGVEVRTLSLGKIPEVQTLAQSLTIVQFAWSWTHSDTFTRCEDAPQNHLWNGWAVVEVSEFLFRVFCLILTICPATHYGPFSMNLDLFGYPHTPRRCSTKPFTKRLSRCGGRWLCISCFLTYTHHLPSHSLWSVFHDLKLVQIPSQLREDAPKNRLRNGWAIVEVSEFVFRVFCLMLTICSVTYYDPFCMIFDLIRHLHTPWRWSTQP